MSPICLSLVSLDFKVLLYADDIVIFSPHRYLDRSINISNSALKMLSSQLYSSFFTKATEKSSFIIFTRIHSHLVLDYNIIQPSSSVAYLGLKLDPKLKWIPHFQYLKDILSRWSNFLRATAGSNWGSHLSFP
jgi:hypothetical protein